MARLSASHCVFPVKDIKKTAQFYQDKLGFSPISYLHAAEPHTCLYRDSTEIILTKTNGQEVIPNRYLYGYGYDAYFITDEQEALQSEFQNKGVKIAKQLSLTDYHNQEFVIEDIDGRWIGFGKKEQ